MNPEKDKKKIVLVSIYLAGVYPPGEEDVVSRLLATSNLKAAADADSEIAPLYDIKILDVKTTTDIADIAETILLEEPDILAYSVYMWNYDQVAGSMDMVKAKRPDITTILGGPLVTYTPAEVMAENSGADIIVCGGGGELRFRELLKSGFDPDILAEIPKICFRDGDGEVVFTEGEAKEDVSQIPSIFETGAYDLDDGRRHTVFVETFRGCPFSCGYCIWGGPESASVHKLDLDQVCRDIDIIYNNPNVDVVFFTDACLFYTRKRARVVCDRIGAASRRIPTVFTLDIHVLDEDMCKHLSQLNLYQNLWHFGLQTTNPVALDILKRPGGGELEKYRHKIGLLREYIPNAETSFDIIYGLPGDDFDKFRETTNFTLELRPSKIHFSPLLLLPGTRFFNERDSLDFVYDDRPPYMVRANETFTPEDMRKAVDLVLWVMAVLYFPAIRDAFFDLHEFNASLRPVDIIEEWAKMLGAKVNPVADIHYDFTLESNNEARRSVMNTLTEPENCILGYEAAQELLEKYKAGHLADNVRLGVDYYRAVLNGMLVPNHESEFEDANQLADQGVLNVKDLSDINYVKHAWVTAA